MPIWGKKKEEPGSKLDQYLAKEAAKTEKLQMNPKKSRKGGTDALDSYVSDHYLSNEQSKFDRAVDRYFPDHDSWRCCCCSLRVGVGLGCLFMAAAAIGFVLFEEELVEAAP